MLYTEMAFSYIRRLLGIKKKPMIIAIGDIHGKIGELSDKIDGLNFEHRVNFVHLGDFGLGFDNPIREHRKLKDLDYTLTKSGSKMFVIRGNHDNPTYWTQDGSYEMENIQFVPDNTVMEVEGKVCLFAGGAISIDRINRMKGVNYWPNEEYKWHMPSIVPTRIDHVFTHDVYQPCSPFKMESPITMRWLNSDKTLKGSLEESQAEMKKLYDFLMSLNDDFSWYHGHYHESHTTIRGKQKTYSVSIMELKEVI